MLVVATCVHYFVYYLYTLVREKVGLELLRSIKWLRFIDLILLDSFNKYVAYYVNIYVYR